MHMSHGVSLPAYKFVASSHKRNNAETRHHRVSNTGKSDLLGLADRSRTAIHGSHNTSLSINSTCSNPSPTHSPSIQLFAGLRNYKSTTQSCATEGTLTWGSTGNLVPDLSGMTGVTNALTSVKTGLPFADRGL